MKIFCLSFLALTFTATGAFAGKCSLVESTLNADGTYIKIEGVPFVRAMDANIFTAATTNFSATVWLNARGAHGELKGPLGSSTMVGASLPLYSQDVPSVSLVEDRKLDIPNISLSAEIKCAK